MINETVKTNAPPTSVPVIRRAVLLIPGEEPREVEVVISRE